MVKASHLDIPGTARYLGVCVSSVKRKAHEGNLGIYVPTETGGSRLVALSKRDIEQLRRMIRPTRGNPLWIEEAKKKRRK